MLHWYPLGIGHIGQHSVEQGTRDAPASDRKSFAHLQLRIVLRPAFWGGVIVLRLGVGIIWGVKYCFFGARCVSFTKYE